MAAALPADENGLIFTSDAEAVGARSELTARHRSGELWRVSHGVYAPASHLAGLSPARRDAERYRLRVLAAARRRTAPVFTSFSAAALLGLPIVGPWPEELYVLSGTPHGRRRAGVVGVAHRGDVPSTYVDGVAVTSMEHTLIQVARHGSLAAALTAFDAALRVSRAGEAAPLTTLDRLEEEHERLLPYHGSARVTPVLRRATDRSDGPLETMSRIVIEELGFAQPELQTRFWLPDLGQYAYPDFYWREVNVGGEADGHGKYATSGAQEAVEAVLAEKRREDALREQLDRIVRWEWDDMWQREPLARKLERAGVPRGRRRRCLLPADAAASARGAQPGRAASRGQAARATRGLKTSQDAWPGR